jgi:hypothetical protein
MRPDMKESSDVMIVIGALLAAAIFATGQDSSHEWKLRWSGSPDKVHFTGLGTYRWRRSQNSRFTGSTKLV